jgi:chromatin segregation and condensation protein Rec8/ScpA/Scc1 (kleisin family)
MSEQTVKGAEAARRKRRHAGELVMPSTGAIAPVLEGEGEDEALARAARELPAFRERAERLRQRRERGERGAPADEVYARLGYTPPDRRPSGRRPKPERASGRLLVRLPVSVHRQLVAQAEQEGVSVNQLVLNYVSRGLGLAGVEAATPQ